MTAIRFFTDEDVFGTVARALRAAGFDTVSTPEAGRLGESDESQLEWAEIEGRAFLTFNVAHFAALHGEWLRQGRHHSGLILSNQRPLGDLLRRLLKLALALDAETMRDRLEFLSDW
jgi:uncharacterized protein with PIN domain